MCNVLAGQNILIFIEVEMYINNFLTIFVKSLLIEGNSDRSEAESPHSLAIDFFENKVECCVPYSHFYPKDKDIRWMFMID